MLKASIFYRDILSADPKLVRSAFEQFPDYLLPHFMDIKLRQILCSFSASPNAKKLVEIFKEFVVPIYPLECIRSTLFYLSVLDLQTAVDFARILGIKSIDLVLEIIRLAYTHNMDMRCAYSLLSSTERDLVKLALQKFWYQPLGEMLGIEQTLPTTEELERAYSKGDTWRP